MSNDSHRLDAAICPRLAVTVNGVLRATAGLDRYGVLSALVGHHTKDPAKVSQQAESGEDAGPTTYVNLGSLDSQSDEFRDWLLEEPLKPGDVVVIEVLPPGSFDPPTKARPGAEVRRGWEQGTTEE